MGAVTGVGGIGFDIEDGAGGQDDLLESMGAFKRVDVLDHSCYKSDDVLYGGRGTEGVVWVHGGINRADGNGEFRFGGGGDGFTFIGIRRMGPVTGVAYGRGGEVRAVLVEVGLLAVGTGGGFSAIFR